ncbi:MAG: dihydroxy-acid dehydratase [SAR86 cluster bacterium]|jgi:dihydroxy-acid dehydratase|nr:dihydroxy-acid dehydratase [SAR86 cluster bacterium]|tara:strand:- start:5028 stop:6701 length:1674 start_codon:yes stop_codon:yes gene_type:complete
MSKDKRKYSSEIVDGVEQAPSRAMLRAVGFDSEDFKKPQVGVASTWSMVTPCNMHIDKLAEAAANGADNAGSKAVIFNTITVSDGISMGTKGMRYSLVSREVIADSIETVVGGQGFDGVITIGGCDKNMPACLMAMARLNRPSIFVYGGSIKPGANRTDVVSVFEAVGKHSEGSLSDIELLDIESSAIPGPGSCGGMYTANTMASAIEALGMSLPNSSAQEAISASKLDDSSNAGEAIMHLISEDIKPRDIMTKGAFENAIAVVIALGGSTNAVLHLLAIAHEAKVDLNLDDFERIGKRTPVLADLRPSGNFLMSELIEIGGIVPLMKIMLEQGLLDGSQMTVTGKTLEENLKDCENYPIEQEIVRDIDKPIKSDSHLRILYGNLAPQGAVAKISGKEGLRFEGKAKVYDSEESAMEGILSNQISEGDVLVIRYEGPRGAPGMREMLSPTSAIMGKGLGDKVAFLTDGRFSGGTHGFVVGHITPEAFDAGPIAFIKDGDFISIDAETNQINLDLTGEEIQKRKENWVCPVKDEEGGVLDKYRSLVTSASEGAVTTKK